MADEQGAMAVIENSTKVLDAFSSLANAASSLNDLVKLFSGGDDGTGQILDALAALNSTMTKGFEKLEEAVNDLGNKDDWRGTSDRIQDWTRRITDRKNELRNLDPVTLKMDGGKGVSLADWCEKGINKRDTGALDDIYELLRDISTYLPSGAVGAPSPLETWRRIAEDGTFARWFGEKGETLYSQLLAFQSSLLSIVQSAALLHNSMLALYHQTAAPKTHAPVDSLLADLGSNVPKSGVWGDIEAILEDFRNSNAGNDDRKCAMWAVPALGNPSGEATQLNFWDSLPVGRPEFLAGETVTQGNSYVTGLNFALVTKENYRYWYLQGTVATIDPVTGERTFRRGVSALNAAVAAGDVSYDRDAIHLTNGRQFCGGYVAEPACPPGASPVVTGFRIQLVGDVLVLALQYGILRIDERGVQTVERPDPTFHLPNPGEGWWWDKGEIYWVDTSETGPVSRLPLTNATFQHIDDGEGQYHLYVHARTAWTGYQADVHQPAHLARYSPPAPGAAPRTEAAMPQAT